MFYGLGTDGTVGANKNSIKIIGEDTDNYVQGYFVYDSKKAGVLTVSHLRFGPEPIRSAYLVNKADFVACHVWAFLERYKTCSRRPSRGPPSCSTPPSRPTRSGTGCPTRRQQRIIDLGLKVYAINAYEVAKETGMGGRINTIMQTCFFYLSSIIPPEEAIAAIKKAIKKTYGKRGEEVVQKNYNAVDQAIANLHEIEVPAAVTSHHAQAAAGARRGAGVRARTSPRAIMAGQGDELPVSQHARRRRLAHRHHPVGEAQHRPGDPGVGARSSASSAASARCTARTPPSAPRSTTRRCSTGAPATFKSVDAKGKEYAGQEVDRAGGPRGLHRLRRLRGGLPRQRQGRPEPQGHQHGLPAAAARDASGENYEFFLAIPDPDRTQVRVNTVKGSQLLRPLFEYSGACAGCGETPYVKLLTQLFGDRLLIGNATGCSSIYGGNLPTTPYAKNDDGRGPAWNNSLFEDAAEFSYGLRLTVDKQTEFARELVTHLRDVVGDGLADELLASKQADEAEIAAQRARVAELKTRVQSAWPRQRRRPPLRPTRWRWPTTWSRRACGASAATAGPTTSATAAWTTCWPRSRNINLLVLNTQMYSNTGGQCSKATPMGSVALFAAGGKTIGKKDLGSIAMTYGNIYVAQVAMGYSDSQTVRAFVEAESYDGPSLIIAYSHCISMGFDMTKGYEQQKAAVEIGLVVLYRFDPRLAAQGKNPCRSTPRSLRCRSTTTPTARTASTCSRSPIRRRPISSWHKAQKHVWTRWEILKQQAAITYSSDLPFETGVLREETTAAAGEVTGIKTGVNMPAGGPC